MPTIEDRLAERLLAAVQSTYPELEGTLEPPEISIPKDESFGDYSANVALLLAKRVKRPPREVAEKLVASLGDGGGLLREVTVAGPGFLNLSLARAELEGVLGRALEQGERYGHTEHGAGRKMQVEFVSANPTGPLNVVNARAAAFGGTLARLLNAAGYSCDTEFYVNDVGTQIDLLGKSLKARFQEVHQSGPGTIPENGYRGEYMLDLARGLDASEVGDASSPDADRRFSALAVERMLAWQRRDLEAYGTTFDRWFRQSELYPDAVQKALEFVRERGYVVEKEGAQWLATTRFGDDQDRVLVRSNGEPTYFLADLAYHADKHSRGNTHSIDIWGPDHHGHIPRMQAGVQVLGFGSDWLEVIIVQQVNLLSKGQPVKMSKREGEFITLDDLVRDVGRDSAIFFFLMRRANSHLDFDMDLARSTTDENPVYYVKYAHARISSLLRVAAERNTHGADDPAAGDPSLLEHPTELALMRLVAQYPDLVRGAAVSREPHRLTNYLRRLSGAFHPFYHQCRVVDEAADVAHARLLLCAATRQVLANGLALMHIDAPESM